MIFIDFDRNILTCSGNVSDFFFLERHFHNSGTKKKHFHFFGQISSIILLQRRHYSMYITVVEKLILKKFFHYCIGQQTTAITRILYPPNFFSF